MIMLKIKQARFSVLAFCLLLFIGTGCAVTSQPSRFYVLSPMAGMEMEKKAIADTGSLSISIGPVSLPKYLRKSQIVTRTGSNELQLAEFDRWAGKIEEDIGRVVAENLAHLLSTDRVLSYPAIAAVQPDYTVEVDISRFDGSLGGDVELIARWAIFDGHGNIAWGITSSRMIEPVQGGSYADLVAAQSRALAAFSGELGEAIRHLAGR